MSKFSEFFHKLSTTLQPIWEAIEPSVDALGSATGQQVLALATKFVEQAATDPTLTAAGGSARAQWVQTQIKSVTTGNPVADSLINLAIEVALQKYKASTSKK